MFGFGWSLFAGVLLGFGFGVGCALAVMYSIYMGGYRAALRDAQLEPKPERYLQALSKIARSEDSLRAKTSRAN